MLDFYYRRTLRGGANPSLNRNSNNNSSPGKTAEYGCVEYVFCSPQVGLGLKLGLRFELGLAPHSTFSTNYFVSVAPATDTAI